MSAGSQRLDELFPEPVVMPPPPSRLAPSALTCRFTTPELKPANGLGCSSLQSLYSLYPKMTSDSQLRTASDVPLLRVLAEVYTSSPSLHNAGDEDQCLVHGGQAP